MVVLNHITSAIDRTQRVKLNENWEIIREAFLNLQRQINILAGEEVDDLLARIARAIESSEASVGEINQLITDVEQKLLEVTQATTTANESAQNADNKASLADTATTNANDARDGALQAIADTKVILEDFTTRMTTALTNAEAATTSANNATTETLAAKVKAEEALVEAVESKSLADQAIIDANNALTTANQASEKANQAADNIAGYDLPIVDFVIGDTYIKHQAVRDNGSTYRAKVETTGNPLPVSPNTETDFWTLEAKAGRDGEGTVQSVNNELPDEDGNVTIVFPPTDWSEVPNKPTEFTPTTHNQPMNTIDELEVTLQAINDSIALIGQTGIPKLVSYPFVVDIVEDQVAYPIPLVSFDKSNDTLFVFKNTIVLYEQEHYTVNSQNEVVLNEPPLSGKMLFVILKNVPIGPSGSVSGSVMGDGTITKNKLEQSIQDILDNANRELTVGEATEVNLVRDFNILNVATKSLAEVKRINGRTIVNLLPLLQSGAWVFRTGAKPLSDIEAELAVAGDLKSDFYITMYLLKKVYTLSYEGNGKGHIDIYKSSTDNTPTRLTFTSSPFTFDLTGYTEIYSIGIAFTNYVVGDVRRVVTKPMLVEGNTAKPFVANVKGLTNPTFINETNGTSSVIPTTLYEGEYLEPQGFESVKYRKYNEVIMDNRFTYSIKMHAPDHKIILVPFSELPNIKTTSLFDNDARMVKYNGMVMNQGTGSGLNNFNIANNGTELSINVPNIDSGWGPAYNPTLDEIRAFFLGWRMYQVEEATNTGNIIQYNGVGTKIWAVRHTPNSPHEISAGVLVKGTGTQIVPTVTPADYGYPYTSWRPYRLIYERITPLKEVIRPMGNLTLEDGANTLTLKEGRIVGERAGIQSYSNEAYINGTGVPLSRKVSKMLNVYKNGVRDTTANIIKVGEPDIAKVGIEYVTLNAYDPTSVYSVDYEPLNVWDVSTPIVSADIEYRSNLKSVVEELVDEIAGNSNDIAQLQKVKTNKMVESASLRLTLLNGHTGTLWVTILEDGQVILETRGTLSPPTGGFAFDKIIAMLPKGFRPFVSTLIPGSHTEKLSTITTANVALWVHSDGRIIPGTTSDGIYATFLNGTFKGGN